MSEKLCPFHAGGAAPAHVPADLVFAYDYRQEELIAEHLWEMCADMADMPEIFWSTARGGHWVATSAAALEAICERPDLFSSRAGQIPTTANKPLFIPASLDPPVHTSYRKVMAQRMFSARALGDLEAETAKVCSIVLDAFAADGRCEFVEAFARRVPVDLFLTLMGEPPERRTEFLPWVERLFRPASVEDYAAANKEASDFTDRWLRAQIEGGANQGVLYQAMAAVELDGRPLTYEEMHNISMMLFLGGLDTVVSQLTHVARFLAENPEHQARLRAEPELIPSAMEELLRRFSITNFVRQANADMDFHGVRFRKGDLVLLCTPFASLDRRMFDDPLKVDFDRARRVRHYGFGHGIHLCIGAHMARVQVEISLRQLLARLPEFHLEEGARPLIVSGGTFTMRDLRLRWGAASPSGI